MILPDHEIEVRCRGKSPLVEPFLQGSTEEGIISYGLSSCGYDLRLAKEIWTLKHFSGENDPLTPKKMKDEDYIRRMYNRYDFTDNYDVKSFVLPPHGCCLAKSMEYLRIPCDLCGRCVGKSTWARCNITVNTTPLEPGWEGYLTLEISNLCNWPVELYFGEGIAQLQFEQLSSPVRVSYADKKGKYQKQVGVVPGIVH